MPFTAEAQFARESAPNELHVSMSGYVTSRFKGDLVFSSSVNLISLSHVRSESAAGMI